VRGEDNYSRGGHGFEHLARCQQTIEQGHCDIHQDYVRAKFFCQFNRPTSVLRFTNNLNVIF